MTNSAPAPAAVEDVARELMRYVVLTMQTRPNDMIAAAQVMAWFNNPPWQPGDLRNGLIHAQQKGWITEEGMLTKPGHASVVG